MFIPSFTVSMIRKNGAITSSYQTGDLIKAMEIAQNRRSAFPDAEISIILDGVGVLHKFAPIKNTLS